MTDVSTDKKGASDDVIEDYGLPPSDEPPSPAGEEDTLQDNITTKVTTDEPLDNTNVTTSKADDDTKETDLEKAKREVDEVIDEIDANRSVGSTDTSDTEELDVLEADKDDAPTDDTKNDDSSPEIKLMQALAHKEEGNAQFKEGDYTAATRSYRRGTNALKNLNANNTGDDQVKQLLITLQTNLSMVCYKQEKHKMSRDVATKAIEIESTNVKALYRRAVAHRAMGDVDSAKDDLRLAYKNDPDNIAVKKELKSIKKILEDRKAKEKARLSKAFSKGGSSLLYSDKEEEEKRKAEELKQKELKEKEALEKRKAEWEDECVQRMSSDPPQEAISFDDWDKQRRKREEEEEKARKKAKKEEDEKRRAAQKAQRDANKSVNNTKDDSDDEELTAAELAMLRGYKKTSDGRTTSYFNREQTEKEKELLGCIAPKRLDDSAAASSPTKSSGVGGASVWNASGTTWEEKDTTDWCKNSLEKCLIDTKTAYYSEKSTESFVAVVKKVTDLKGDASVAIAGGKKRYIYDFHVDIEYEIVDGASTVIATGVLKLPEVHSGNTSDEEELDVQVNKWKTGPKAPDGESGFHTTADCVECRNLLVSDIRKSVLSFVEKFNANF